MNEKFNHAVLNLVLLVGIGAVATTMIQSSAIAALPITRIFGEDEYGTRTQTTGPLSTPSTPRMSKTVGAILKSALDAAGKRDWSTANAKLIEARAVPNPSDFDLFEIDVVASFVAINTGDHATALATYKRVIASPLFATAQTAQEQKATLKNAMILSNEAGDFAGAISFGEKMAASGPMDDASAAVLAVAYFGNKDYAKAQNLAQRAIDAAIAGGKKPDESALQVVLKSKAMQR